MDISKTEKLVAMFSNGDDSLGDVAAGMLLGKLKGGGGDSGDNSGCGCAIFLILILFGIVLFYILKNS